MAVASYYRGLMAQYRTTINNYESIISQVSGLYSYLGNCSSTISECKTLMQDTVIDGEAIDKGKLDNISSVLEGLKSLFNTVIAECRSQIDYYEGLYNNAAAMAAKLASQESTGVSETSVS